MHFQKNQLTKKGTKSETLIKDSILKVKIKSKNKNRQVYIGIAGNIGCGKTTLTEMLAAHYQWEPRYEAVVDNPYMEDYYKDLQRWSFAMEVFFFEGTL